MANPPRIRLGALTIMAARPRELARFYSRLLSWPYIREEARVRASRRRPAMRWSAHPRVSPNQH